MTTTARQALSALIDDLVAAPAQARQPHAVRPQRAPAFAPPVADSPVRLPEQRTAQQTHTVLPTGTRNAILWRSRTD